MGLRATEVKGRRQVVRAFVTTTVEAYLREVKYTFTMPHLIYASGRPFGDLRTYLAG
jgi:hypothetical protein